MRKLFRIRQQIILSMLTFMVETAQGGNCTGELGVYVCSGGITDNDQTIILLGVSGKPTIVTTTDGFGLSTQSNYSMMLASNGNGITLIDDYKSTISSVGFGMYVSSENGDLFVKLTGDVINLGDIGRAAIAASISKNAEELTLQVANTLVTDHYASAINVSSFGENGKNITLIATGDTVSTNGWGITGTSYADNAYITATNIIAGIGGISFQNYGNGESIINVTGEIHSMGKNAYAVNIINSENAKSLIINVNDILSEGSGIYAVDLGSGTGFISITTTGLVTALGNGSYGIFTQSTKPISINVQQDSLIEGSATGIEIQPHNYGIAKNDVAVEITNSGTIRNISDLSSSNAIKSQWGMYPYEVTHTIVNNGLIKGQILLSSLTGGQYSMTNNVGSIWDLSGGISFLGNSKSTLDNYGLITAANLESFGGYQSTILTVTNFNNSGTISLDNALAGDNFTLNGNYIGKNGYLLLNTELNDDNSASDLLYITGSTSGSTYVTINNVGEMGAATLNGIRVIQIGGESNGEFIQTGRIVAGAYDYWLTKASNNKDWKLISTFIAAKKPEIITQPIESIPTEALTLPIEPALSTETKISTEPTLIEESVAIERPELGIYSASLSTANTLFIPSLQDRKGVAQEVGVALRIFQPFGIMQAQSQTTNTKRLNNLWIRSEGRHQQINDTHAQLKTQSNSYVFQLGKDLVQWVEQKVARFSFGVMAGYGESRSNTHSSISHYNAEGMLRGYSFGVYGLGGANTVDNTGLYVDTLVNV
ncbi:autotransporter outer membrane beta-barrel domain-containing protein [Providencia manganoxydans]|uniref:autotransporter outer membrane beta-barrel domain-containing protein n=1 Tax=Providencia manganoxydans TaxID=2923283 RepID=UPI0034E38D62